MQAPRPPQAPATRTKIVSHLRSIFDTEASGRLIIFSPLVGLMAGLAAALFFQLLNLIEEHVLGNLTGYFPPPAGSEPVAHPVQWYTCWWAVLLLPAAGGLICGLLVYGFAPEAEGHGSDAMIRAFHRLGGRIRTRVPFIKILASAVTIGTGGSAGREGPIAQVGAGIGSLLAKKFSLTDRDRRLLMLAGAAAGIGAIFRAPLGGALFVSEVLYASTALEFAAVIPCFISAITAYTVFSSILGPGLVFNTPDNLAFNRLSELPYYLIFAVICALVGHLYVRVFYGLRDHFFRRLPIPHWVKPGLGGLLLGGIALLLPQLMAGGYGWIQEAIDGHLPLKLLAVLCLGKIVATSFTISSGGSGGVFAPSLFIGAMLGGAFGLICNHLVPGAIEHPEAFVLVGMGGFFAGVARVPLTGMLMVCEMSGSYGLLLPLMLVSIVNVALLSSRWTLYEEQVAALIDSPAHMGDFIVDVLEQIRVRDVLNSDRNVDLVHEGMPLSDILTLAATSSNTYFPVVNDHKQLVGIFSLGDLRRLLLGHSADQLIRADDVATQRVLTVTLNDDLHTALRRFTQKNIDDIPVVSADAADQVLGMLSRRDVIAAYHDRVTELQHEDASHDVTIAGRHHR